mgnify:CR=1 FL=1
MIQKRIQIAQTALSDPGNGIPIYSMHRTLREVMKMSDKEIADNINEIRLEKALASELEKTNQIIKIITKILDIIKPQLIFNWGFRLLTKSAVFFCIC